MVYWELVFFFAFEEIVGACLVMLSFPLPSANTIHYLLVCHDQRINPFLLAIYSYIIYKPIEKSCRKRSFALISTLNSAFVPFSPIKKRKGKPGSALPFIKQKSHFHYLLCNCDVQCHLLPLVRHILLAGPRRSEFSSGFKWTKLTWSIENDSREWIHICSPNYPFVQIIEEWIY